MDLFKPLDINLSELIELVENRPEKLFEKIRSHVEKKLGEIRKVSVYNVYFNPETMTIVVEYLIEHANGESSLKIIYSDNPAEGLKEYYDYEKSLRKRNYKIT